MNALFSILCVDRTDVLNLNAMRFLGGSGILFLTWVLAAFFPQTGAQGLKILSPQGGEALQGAVEIRGTVNLEGLQSYEIAFGYSGSDPAGQFLIGQGDQAVNQDVLAVWDTTQISDGTYDLVLRATLEDGSQQELTVSGLRVRNYTAIETATVNASQAESPALPAPTLEPSLTPVLPTATPYGPNPGTVTPADVNYSLLRGVSFTAIVFVVLGFYVSIQRRNRRR